MCVWWSIFLSLLSISIYWSYKHSFFVKNLEYNSSVSIIGGNTRPSRGKVLIARQKSKQNCPANWGSSSSSSAGLTPGQPERQVCQELRQMQLTGCWRCGWGVSGETSAMALIRYLLEYGSCSCHMGCLRLRGHWALVLEQLQKRR